MNRDQFRARYGAWALVAGASEGMGSAFAEAIAKRGLNLVLVSRRAESLDEVATRIRNQHGVEVRTVPFDLASAELAARAEALATELEIGLLVYNAAASSIGNFVDRPLEEQLHIVDLNCKGPLVLSHVLGKKMAERKRGGLLLMSSLTATQGAPFLATYAASKAFNLIFGESLWHELRSHGVDVFASRPGATRTPAYERSKPDFTGPVMEPEPVVEAALSSLGTAPSRVAGGLNKLASFFMGHLMTRRQATQLMGNTTAKIYKLQS